ncbi:MAG: hypothetical protein HQL76_02475 [Magnetococcales bacterium]|nr:hypothetical protein [Magnetococcales bacterium]
MMKSAPLDLYRPAPEPPPVANPIPPEHQERIRASLQRFRRQHGQRLASLGWNRDNLFLGTSPDEAKSYDHLHGMAALIADGASLIHSDRNHLVFLSHGRKLRWVRAGYWLGGFN